ncbi:MAG: O-antigen ligase family protein [Elusimicrobiaceae bacterium]|nr:O-antigen ligase family protein [Elusimicrobiaceae bacterium]
MAKTSKTKAKVQDYLALEIPPSVSFLRKAIIWWLPILYLLVSNAFYLRTYDSAQIKITLVQMGGLALIALWGCLLASEGKKAFRKPDFVVLAPFLAYAGYIIFSFLQAPYRGPSVDDFIRYMVYMTVSLMVIREFNLKSVNLVTRILIVSAWITLGYGVLQIIDYKMYPTNDDGGLRMSLDPFIWRGAFGSRVFSTYGNPNFFGNYLVIIFFILLAQFLKNMRKHWTIVLLLLADLTCLWYTETKGAWVGFAIGLFAFVLVYSLYFLRHYYKERKWVRPAIVAVGLAVMLGCFSVVIMYAGQRMQSVNFRVFTWLSTYEMIETRPLIGTGAGSFKVIYPAFRRPQIFHIEGKHNTETDHAEDEYLEQWFDNGIIGGGIFLWLVFFTILTGLRALNEMTSDEKGSGSGLASNRAYDLMGYLIAFVGMLCHNFFDVSMRFVSSGVYLGLLPGLIIVLSRGNALYEVHEIEDRAKLLAAQSERREEKDSRPGDGPALWIMRFAGWLVLGIFVVMMFRQFSELQGPQAMYIRRGDVLQWNIAWLVFIGIIAGLGYMFVRGIYLSASKLVPVIVLLMLWPMYFFWGFFKADVYHNLALFNSRSKNWDEALKYYQLVNKYNPYFIMAYYFRANVHKDRLDMDSVYKPEWGDKKDTPRTDYERATDIYNYVKTIAPNYVQMHYHVGELYVKMADYYFRKNDSANGKKFLDMALGSFKLYHEIDPVFPYTYYHRSNIYMSLGNVEKAERELKDNLYAPYCHEPGHTHENADDFIKLAEFEARVGKEKDALASFQEARAFIVRDAQANPENPDIAKKLGQTDAIIAQLKARLGGAGRPGRGMAPAVSN